MTVERLEREMSSRELSEWLALQSLDPLPDPYWIGAQQCAVTASSLGGAKNLTIDDFRPVAAPKRQLTVEETMRAVRGAISIGRTRA